MILYRRMTINDITDVVNIEATVSAFPWTDAMFRDCLKDGYSAWVLNDTASLNRIRGFGILSIAANEAHVLNIAIQPAQQRRGLGTQFMHHLLADAQSQNAHALFLEVRHSNHTALKVYQKIGFQVIGSRKGYYPHPQGREDAWVLKYIFHC